ncbi:MAG TPA: hypothetical protein VKG84_15410 [Candidatus Acidoferrales bacterium]|nr:hypothetical protein [Candidatus Acidoferrales bacterium]
MTAVRRLPLVVLSLILLVPAALFAQDKDASLETLLPADTLAFASWKGAAGMTAREKTNALLQLWNDPDLAPARALMASGMFSQDTKDVPPMTNEEVTQLAGNPALFALIKLPPGVKAHEKPAAAKTSTKTPGEMEVAILILYDGTGREKLTGRLLQWTSEGKSGAITKTSFHGMDVFEIKSGTDVTYRTLAGHYIVQSDYREVLEHWATRMAGAAPGRGTLVETAEFRAVRARTGPDAVVTMFFNLHLFFEHVRGDIKEEQGKQAWDAMHFDRIHGVVGSVTLGEPATRVEVSVLGDLEPGGFFDVIGASGPDFPTLRITPATVFSYSATRLDLSALYRVVRSIFESLVPAGQGVMFNNLDAIITAQFGMSMTEMLKLLSGDFTFIKQEPAGDLSEGIFVLGVEKPADVRHVLELLLTSNITNEETIGDVTLLSVMSPVADPAPQKPGEPKPRGRFYYVAMGPKMLVVAHRKSDARSFLTRVRETEGTSSLGSDPKFQAVRARLPKNLSAVSYSDLSRVDWKDVVDKVAALQKTPMDPQKIELIKNMFPAAAFTRHLHSFVTGMWKDRTGIFYDGYIE